MYGGATINGVKGSYTLIMQSTDRGKSWTQRSLLNTDGDSTELALSRTSDGRLVGISRAAEAGGTPTKPMWQFYSDDDGLTWTKQPYVPPAGYPKFGIMPELVLQPNGALLLTYGRPDNYVAVSWDGTGRTWDDGKLVYSNYIRDTKVGRWMGSSGNTSLAPAEANYSLNFGDICHNIWSCSEYGQQTGIWVRRVDAATGGVGKIDLATGVRQGVTKLSGSVTAADARFAQQRLEGAVDGSSEYRAAARFANAGAANRGLVIELDKAYPINKIGLMLDRGTANSAKVQLSTDGKNWGRPVVQQRNSTDYAVRYHQLSQPVTAKYVRITSDAGAPLTAVNEVELYADTYTFENDPVNAVPRGLKDTLHALTADTFRYMGSAHSQRRLNLIDSDPDSRARATFEMSARAKTTVAFDYSGQGYGAGPVWELIGKDASGNAVTGWKFHLAPDFANKAFKLSAWNGTAWVSLGNIGTWVENYNFFPISISATADSATVTVSGDAVTTDVKAGTVASFNGFRPSTGINDTDINIEHSYDNVSIG
ncbi:discoidin domain-containing protein [Nakamurella aerolata]|uniref:F5/8 type C domain-containing protein n=1 Tax=Nakamurella aerolata TaxID=1656892 RepID=A0A849AC38_9ACTN|nr:discoidin domain-containing protein [Nakamurella aerolata]NNG36698.1 hypothetical protein [Nakamurella aerolata]